MKLVPEEEESLTTVKEEGIIDIPYEIVIAVGDIILIDQSRLSQVTRPKKQATPPVQQKHRQKAAN